MIRFRLCILGGNCTKVKWCSSLHPIRWYTISNVPLLMKITVISYYSGVFQAPPLWRRSILEGGYAHPYTSTAHLKYFSILWGGSLRLHKIPFFIKISIYYVLIYHYWYELTVSCFIQQVIICFFPFNFNTEFVQIWLMGRSPFKLASMFFRHVHIFLWLLSCILAWDIPGSSSILPASALKLATSSRSPGSLI